MVRAFVWAVLCASACALGSCGERGGLDPAGGGVGAGGTPASHGGTSGAVAGAVGAVGTGGGNGGSSTSCDVPLGNRVWPETLEAVLAAMQGTWLRCGHPLTSDDAEVGLLITADNHFSILVSGLDGTPVPVMSVLERGEVVVTSLTPYNGHLTYDVDFASDGNLAYRTRPFFTDNVPRQMATTNTDVIWQRYVFVGP